jgi:N-acetylglucosamine-6-sulfatase
MRRTVLLLTSVGSAVVLCLALMLFTGAYREDGKPEAAAQTAAKPNFVFILADDMRKDDLNYMPKTTALLGEKGMTFDEAFVSHALCCPSRATIFRGQYTHNHGVWHNDNKSLNSTDGGWYGYKFNGNEQDNVATRLRGGGYRTGLFGKYFNTYDGSVVPVGWDEWFAMVGQGAYFDYDVNANGTIKHYGTRKVDYSTDVLSTQIQRFIDKSINRGKPFFAYVAPKAPHAVAKPAPRDRHSFDSELAPRLLSFNEEDVSDKPTWISSLPSLSSDQIAEIDTRHKQRVETLQALDDLVEAVISTLSSVGALDNTYVFFTSDNGWHHGEHRIPKDKAQPYEEDIRMPLLVRGPGVQAGATTEELVLNTDYFPTFTDLAGIQTPEYVDGRSLRPLFEGSAASWRSAVLLEQRKRQDGSLVAYSGIRTSDGRKYIEYQEGFRELYDLRTDPYELANSYDVSAPPAKLAARLEELKGCAGATCRTAEDGAQPPPPPPP